MLPFKYDIKKFEGETLNESIRLMDRFNNPISLEGYTAIMQVRTSAEDDETPLLELTTENGGITIDEEAGRIRLYHPNLRVEQTGVWDLFLIMEPEIYTLFVSPKSKFQIAESVTNVP